MSSQMPPPLLEFDRAVGGAIAVAVSTVAERSFFGCVDRCERPHLGETDGEWLAGTVHFDDGPVRGSLTCSLPADLAQALFDAFSGRDPAAALPARHQLDDMVGEFSNMVCGTWLSRCDARCLFKLGPPVVARGRRPSGDAKRREWLLINNRPVAIDWDLALGSDSRAAEAFL